MDAPCVAPSRVTQKIFAVLEEWYHHIVLTMRFKLVIFLHLYKIMYRLQLGLERSSKYITNRKGIKINNNNIISCQIIYPAFCQPNSWQQIVYPTPLVRWDLSSLTRNTKSTPPPSPALILFTGACDYEWYTLHLPRNNIFQRQSQHKCHFCYNDTDILTSCPWSPVVCFIPDMVGVDGQDISKCK